MPTKLNKLTLQVWEVLQRASGLNDDQQAEVFNEYPYPAVAQVLQIYFGDFDYTIPDTPPPGITASSEESHPTNMHKLLRTSGGLAPFVKGAGYDKLNHFQVERRYVQYLEGIHPKDAELVIALFVNDGRFERLYQISQTAAHKAFPGVVPAPAINARLVTDVVPEAVPAPANEIETFGIPAIPTNAGTEVTTLEFRPEMEVTTATLPATEDEGVSIQLLENSDDPGIVLADYKGPVEFRDNVDAKYTFSALDQNSFEELRRAVMRENHKRKQEAK